MVKFQVQALSRDPLKHDRALGAPALMERNLLPKYHPPEARDGGGRIQTSLAPRTGVGGCGQGIERGADGGRSPVTCLWRLVCRSLASEIVPMLRHIAEFH